MAGPQDWGAQPVGDGSPAAWGAVPVDSFNDRFAATPEPQKIPQAFLDRVRTGQEIAERLKGADPQAVGAAAMSGLKEGFGDEPIALGPATAEQRRRLAGGLGALGIGIEDLVYGGIDIAGRTVRAGIHGIAKEMAARTGNPKAESEVGGFLEWATMRGDALQFSRFHATEPPKRLIDRIAESQEREVSHQPIGPLPKPEDFRNAAMVLDSKTAELNLRDLWQDHGIHPAEAAHDAQGDAFFKGELTAPSFVAYHASPHEFEAFDLNKIGTGEGNQSYGHGLYFAENPRVSGPGGEYHQQFASLGPRKAISDYEVVSNPEGGYSLIKHIGGVEQKIKDFSTYAAADAERADILKPDLSRATSYQVRIHVDSERFLDWDKPLSGQPANVRKIVNDLGLSGEIEKLKSHLGDSGEAIHKALESHFFNQELAARGKLPDPSEVSGIQSTVAKKLSEAGIPGIKYLDQGSRRVGEGSRNFVMFSDKDIEITHKNGLPIIGPMEMAQAIEETGFTGGPGGADVTRPENLPTLEKQPPPPPGRLVDAVRGGVDQLLGLTKNIQGLLDPMATGSNRAMVIAKDAVSTVRRIRWEHARVDAEITRRFDAEQRTRMWNAADEESVAAQLGESREHQGLITLEPDERYFVEFAQGNAQAAWLHAVDAGLVEGEGLPAYTPRMVLNVAAASEHAGPQTLNELGRNVFTRTAQMRQRRFMMAEETEAAAKALVEKKMQERGATPEEIAAALEKVQIARDVRALPTATARLEEAAAWKEMINKIEDVGKAAGNDTVADFNPGGGWFTIAGNPAFTKWGPLGYDKNPITGAMEARKDVNGNVIMAPRSLYMHPEFKGPMRAILDESSTAMKAVPGAPSLYGALMTIKGKSMQAILNSPLIHNEVVWSKVAEAAGGREWLGFNLYFKGNRIVEGHPARANELIERGLAPMGPRGSIQDITAMMEEPSMKAGRSWTAKVAGAVGDLYDPAAGAAARAAIDKAGNFWHNTLLWDRVRDLQFGLADHLSDRLVAKGADRLTADRIGAHFSNIIVGGIPKEAMSAGARATANLFLFSRSFTLGNLSTFKQAAFGLPKPILAQIERDFGHTMVGASEEELAAATAAVKQDAKSIARRKAISTIAMSAGLYYVGNAIIQHAFNIIGNDATVDEEMQGYARRYQELAKAADKDPWELRHLLGRLSPTYDNEPAKQDRAHIGYDKDGTAIYARNPTGKFGEEMIGYPTMPMSMLRRKLSPMAGGILDVLENDKGFGKKIYDENDTTIGGDVATAFAVAKHLVMKHLPEGQINAAIDLVRDEGDPTVNKLRVFGPMAGFTASVGAPGGMARGEQLAAKQQFDARFNLAWPDIKKRVLRGDEEGAREQLMNLGVPMRMQNGLIRNARDPSGALRGSTLRNFYQYSTPEQQERLERARQ